MFAMEVADVETFGEELSPPVATPVELVLELVREEMGAS